MADQHQRVEPGERLQPLRELVLGIFARRIERRGAGVAQARRRASRPLSTAAREDSCSPKRSHIRRSAPADLVIAREARTLCPRASAGSPRSGRAPSPNSPGRRPQCNNPPPRPEAARAPSSHCEYRKRSVELQTLNGSRRSARQPRRFPLVVPYNVSEYDNDSTELVAAAQSRRAAATEASPPAAPQSTPRSTPCLADRRRARRLRRAADRGRVPDAAGQRQPGHCRRAAA